MFALRRALLAAVLLAACGEDPSGEARDAWPRDAVPADAGVGAAVEDASRPAPDADTSPPEVLPRPAIETAAAGIEESWLRARVLALSADEMEGRENGTAGGARAREYLIGELEALGLRPVGDDGWLTRFDEGVNLLAALDGADPALSGEPVLVGAHYDHLGDAGAPGSACRASGGDPICNGAADNASGCAAVLAVARALTAVGEPPRRTVLFAFFDAEEDGLLGSHALVASGLPVPPAELDAMLNLDMIGTEIVPGIDALFALGVERTEGLRDLLAANDAVAGTTTWPVSSFFDGSDDGERSDHYSFRLAGVPSLFFSTGATATYHTPADELDTVNLDLLLRSTRLIFLTTADLAWRSARPSFVDPPRPHLGDAKALLAMGEAVLADPGAVGLDESMVPILEGWLARLRRYVEEPPRTEAEWRTYDDFIHAVITTVFAVLGR